MTPAGLRSLFRYHRQTTGVQKANPHRFRHTFASDMVRAGVSLPALMRLMGHANIQTTLIYVQVTPLDVYQQYARAVAQLIRPVPVTAIVNPSRRAPFTHPLAPVFERRRFAGRRTRPRVGSSLPRHRPQLPHLARRTPSRGCLARSVAPRSAHPRLDGRTAFPDSTAGAGHLHHPTHLPPRHSARTGLDRATARVSPVAPPRGHSTPSAQPAARSLTPSTINYSSRNCCRRNDLGSNFFLLLRHTGMRIGEAVDLSFDCLHASGPDQWTIHVPLGKLKTERMVPVDAFTRDLVQRLRFFRSFDPLPPDGRLLARPGPERRSSANSAPICTKSAAAAGIPGTHRSASTPSHLRQRDASLRRRSSRA